MKKNKRKWKAYIWVWVSGKNRSVIFDDTVVKTVEPVFLLENGTLLLCGSKKIRCQLKKNLVVGVRAIVILIWSCRWCDSFDSFLAFLLQLTIHQNSSRNNNR